MCFMSCAAPDELCAGPFGILQPPLSEDEREFLLLNANNDLLDDGTTGLPPAASGVLLVPDLIIVPALAFDLSGLRLGMGGGYYDRLLALPRYRNCLRLGLAYSFQLVSRLPSEPWDMPVHAICTEQGMLWIHKHGCLPPG